MVTDVSTSVAFYFNIQTCSIHKQASQSALHVTFNGNMKIYCPSTSPCCRRYFFTFNGVECSHPAPIEGLVYHHHTSGNYNHHLHYFQEIEGYCERINAGIVSVALNIGVCRGGYGNSGQVQTGWNTYVRLMIEEVE